MVSSDKQKEWKRQDYQNNKEYFRNKLKLRRIDNAKWLWEYKKDKKCAHCGFSHPAALIFHHINKEEKYHEISFMLINGWSQKKILEEINKCEILCSNCHMIHHHETDIRRIRMDSEAKIVCVTKSEDWEKDLTSAT